MNRRNFLKALSGAIIGTGIAYSFPSIIVPKNIETIQSITKQQLYPGLIEDLWFKESPLFAKMKADLYGFGFTGFVPTDNPDISNYFGKSAMEFRVEKGETYGYIERTGFDYPILWSEA